MLVTLYRYCWKGPSTVLWNLIQLALLPLFFIGGNIFGMLLVGMYIITKRPSKPLTAFTELGIKQGFSLKPIADATFMLLMDIWWPLNKPPEIQAKYNEYRSVMAESNRNAREAFRAAFNRD